MIRLISFLVMVALNGDANPFRQQQPIDTMTPKLPFTTKEPCPVRCMVHLSQAWTTAIAFEIPSPAVMDDKDIREDTDAVSIMCTVYTSYWNCVKACVAASGDSMKGAIDVTVQFSEVCADKFDQKSTSSPCLANNTEMYRDVCKDANEEALAAAVRLATGQTLDKSNMNRYCKAANTQLYCVLPLIRQTCTEEPYDLIRSIANASLIGVRASIGDQEIHEQYPECETYLKTVDGGIPMDISSSTETTTGTTTSSNTTTTAMSTSKDSNTTNLNTTDAESAARRFRSNVEGVRVNGTVFACSNLACGGKYQNPRAVCSKTYYQCVCFGSGYTETSFGYECNCDDGFFFDVESNLCKLFADVRVCRETLP